MSAVFDEINEVADALDGNGAHDCAGWDCARCRPSLLAQQLREARESMIEVLAATLQEFMFPMQRWELLSNERRDGWRKQLPTVLTATEPQVGNAKLVRALAWRLGLAPEPPHDPKDWL